MYKSATLFLVCLTIAVAHASIFNYTRITNYFNFGNLISNETGNELWYGLVRDCRTKVSFSCIQKNAYSYLDSAFVERDNITVFDGLVLKRNNLDYQYCNNVDDNFVEKCGEEEEKKDDRAFPDRPLSPLEEVTSALRQKSVKFLATRDYEIQLPEFFFEGASLKISPREIDENGALVRVDFGQKAVESQGRIFKKLRKYIQNKLLMSFLALMLVIKLIKLKFMFVIPFLFGIGTAKKLFLKLLLFFVPAFAHVFKLCSSYYSSHIKHHHHHHKIAHHHHHVPVPVPVPAVTPTHYDYHPHHHHEEDFDGYDYAHPHIQYRKDMEELKEWGIEPYEEPYEEVGPVYPGPYGISQYASNPRPVAPLSYPDKHAHNLAYSGYIDDIKANQRAQPSTVSLISGVPGVRQTPSVGVVPGVGIVHSNPSINIIPSKVPVKKQPTILVPQRVIKSKISRQTYDDDFYGPIVTRLDEIFTKLGFVEENCKKRLVCSMYKNPAIYAPNSNLVSNELSREIGELKSENPPTESSQRFHLYFNAARLGQDGGDCLRTYPCHVNTE